MGDIVCIMNNEEVPADILLISSSGETALSDTTNIDGELIVKEKHPFVPNYESDRL